MCAATAGERTAPMYVTAGADEEHDASVHVLRDLGDPAILKVMKVSYTKMCTM